MGETTAGQQLTVLDIADILHLKYVFISGGRSRMSFPIMTFPECPAAAAITDEQHKSIVLYLTTIPERQDAELGFVIIIDRRQDKWSVVKTVLLRLVDQFPMSIQKIYLLQPTGFLQKFADTSLKFLKEEIKCKVLMLTSVDELHGHVDRDQLTSDLGGTLQYDHLEWIQHRAALENFSVNVVRIAKLLGQFSELLQETEFPNDVAQTELLIEENEQQRQEVSEDLETTIRNGEVLRDCFASFTSVSSSEDLNGNADKPKIADFLPPSRQLHVTAIERLLSDLAETSTGLENFWTCHMKRLEQCLQLRKFEELFKNLQFSCERHLTTLSAMNGFGNSLVKANAFVSELQTFEVASKDDFRCAKELNERGLEFIMAEHYAVDCIQPKCDELERICTEYWVIFSKRERLLQASLDLQKKIDKATRWCTRGVDLLANQEIEQISTETQANAAQTEIEDFMKELGDLDFGNPSVFHVQYADVLDPETTQSVKDVLVRLEDVKQLCTKRRQRLQSIGPKASSSPVESPKRPSFSKPPSVLTRSLSHFYMAPHQIANGAAFEGELKVNSDSKKWRLPFSKNNSTRSHPKSHFYENSLPELELRSSVDIIATVAVEEKQNELVSRMTGHVIREMVESEKIYIDELSSVLEGYAKQIERPEMAAYVPSLLKGKMGTLFGNMDEIYHFHSKTFLRDLEDCLATPTLVGRCFMARKEEFKMYGIYCQNRSASEDLLRRLGDQNVIFKECQRLLNHRLPLGAYLIKPVQRITKYQLLLKEMLKHSGNDNGCEELNEAIATMLSILKHVNDVMHQISIKGYDGNLADLGQLLMQGSFSVCIEQKKERRLYSLPFKHLSRHIFLYERAILFCKQKEGSHNTSDKVSYTFKSVLQTSVIGLTENVKQDKRKFEIWTRDRSQVYTVQAPSIEVKNAWLVEIRKLLFDQLDTIRDVSLTVNDSSPNKLPLLESALDNCTGDLNVVRTVDCAQETVSRPVMRKRSSLLRHSMSVDESQFVGNQSMSISLFNLQDLTLPSDYVAVHNYIAMEADELTIHEGELLRLIEADADNWWRVQSALTEREGWVPARYVTTAKRLSNFSLMSSQQSISSKASSEGNNQFD